MDLYSSCSSQRNRKRVQYFDDLQKKPEAESAEVVKRLRSTESTSNLSPPGLPSISAIEHQPSNEGLTANPLQNEMERIRKEKDQTIKVYEDTKLQLKSECEKEVEEVVAQIHRKYEVKLQEEEAEFLRQKKELDVSYNKVFLHKILAGAFRSNYTDNGASGSAGAQEVIIVTINTKKGGPRTTLFELCQKLLWPMPTFQETEHKSSTAMEFGKGTERKIGFISFVSKITLSAAGLGIIECTGDARADKKSSRDSAALNMLYELQQQKKIIIGASY